MVFTLKHISLENEDLNIACKAKKIALFSKYQYW